MILDLVELSAGGAISTHLHPIEETIFILDGRVQLWSRSAWTDLGVGDFALMRTGEAHSWRNAGERPVRWLGIHAPALSSRELDAFGHISSPEPLEPGTVRSVEAEAPAPRQLGHLSEEDIPLPGPLSLGGLGYHGSNVRNLSAAMMIDGQNGATHHTMFHIQLPAPAVRSTQPPRTHLHPFEEAFFVLKGETEWQFGDGQDTARAGDLVWAGVGEPHGVRNRGTGDVRWLEFQAPQPPREHGFLFPYEWTTHRDRLEEAPERESHPL